MNQNFNLPQEKSTDSAASVRSFFDKYFTNQITFPSNQIDAVLGYFLKRGFQDQAARSTAIVLLNQAKVDNINVQQLLDSLKGVNDAQLSQLVTEVLNIYREKSSTLGFRLEKLEETLESRNILQ